MPQDYPQNVNTKGVEYVLHRSPELFIVDFGPAGEVETRKPVLFVETNENPGVRCGYYMDLLLGTLLMSNTSHTHHETRLEDVDLGYNTHYVQCWDDYRNTAKQEIEFFVVE